MYENLFIWSDISCLSKRLFSFYIQGSLLACRHSGIGAGLWCSVDTGFGVRHSWLRSWFGPFMMNVFFSKGFLWISIPCLDLGGWMSAGLLCRRSSVMIRMVPGQRTENTFAFLLESVHMALWVQQPLLRAGWASWGTRSPESRLVGIQQSAGLIEVLQMCFPINI